MPTWEYFIMRGDGSAHRESESAALLMRLNNYGSQGWELVSVLTSPSEPVPLYLFKRAKGVKL